MAFDGDAGAEIGLIGLGTMGASLALNIADNGFSIAVFNRTVETTRRFHAEAGALADRVIPCESLKALVGALTPPRAIILMVPAGDAVDQQIAAVRPLLSGDDLIIDAGNANFHDTNRRDAAARQLGVAFLGIGVSGGDEGARYGPSIMGGGPRSCWDRVRVILEAIAAKYEGTPCATWMGEGGAGHFVKTVHNGIEYADMQIIAEAYGIMRDGLNMDSLAIGETFARWNDGPLKSYLIEITAEVCRAEDDVSGGPILDVILDRAGQKGTGRWTAIEAQHLGAPATTIEAAVGARNLSARLDQRIAGAAIFGAAPQRLAPKAVDVGMLEQALVAGKIVCYAQGFELLAAASQAYYWSLPLPDIARVWRSGSIIRSSMLNEMAKALAETAGGNLMFADHFAGLLKRTQADFRQVVAAGSLTGLPVPALGAAVAYFDMMRTARLTTNLVQAQRDLFGAHSFERMDMAGAHHGPWRKD